MLTLKNLKSMVENEPRIKTGMPTIKQLEESDAKILVREMVSDMQITVYQNGYVVCRRGRDATVFRLKDCGFIHTEPQWQKMKMPWEWMFLRMNGGTFACILKRKIA